MMRIAIVIVGLAGAARADAPVPARARTLAKQGLVAHAAGDYTRAIAAFQAAYAIAPNAALLFDLAQAYRLANDCDGAVLMYRRFLAADADVAAATIARTHLATVERCAHGDSAVRLAIPVSAAYVELQLPAVAPAAPRDRDPEPANHTGVALGLGTIGLVAAGVATSYGVAAHAASNEVAAAYVRGAPWREISPIDARGKHDELAAIVWGIGGAVVLAGALGVHLYDRHARRPRLAIAPAHGGARVGVSWSF